MGTVQGCTTYARIGIWQWMLLIYMNLTTASMFPFFFTAFAWRRPLRGCDSRPCRNGGICHNKPSRPQGYYCNCKYDWNGYNCEIWVGRPFNCALKRNGNFEDPFQCPAPHFYQCAGSAGWLSRCDTNLFYDVSTDRCTWRSDVKC